MDRKRAEAEQLYQELRWRKYADDPEAFLRECVYIPSQRDPRGREEFDLFDYQQEALHTFLDNRYVALLKARQIGMSTLIAGLLLWRCLFRPGSVCLWISDSQDNANKAIRMLETMWTFLPEWVRNRGPQLDVDQAGSKEWLFKDGIRSRIRAYAGTGKAGASETASVVVLDEFALVDQHLQPRLLDTAEPTVDVTGGHVWMLSTARGGHNQFAKTFKNAERGESKYVSIFYPWMVSPFLNKEAEKFGDCDECGGVGKEGGSYCDACVDMSVYEEKMREKQDKPWELFSEYPSSSEEAFRESGNPRFPNLPAIEDCYTGWVRGFMRMTDDGPEFVENMDGPLRVDEDLLPDGPAEWREYVMGVDPAQGVGGDYTAAHVMTYDDDALPTIVAWWHANDVEPVDAARQFDPLGRWFNDALMAVEATGGWGDSIINELHLHLRYPRLYTHRPIDKKRRRKKSKIGFPMSHAKRPLVVDRLAEYLREDQQIGGIYPLLRHELGTFVRTDTGKVQADVGCHDDLVMSLAVTNWVLIERTDATEAPKNEEPDQVRHEGTLQNLWDKVDAVREMEREKQLRRARKARRRRPRRRRSRKTRVLNMAGRR